MKYFVLDRRGRSDSNVRHGDGTAQPSHSSREIVRMRIPIADVGLSINYRWCFLLRLAKLLRLPQTVKSLAHMERILTEIKLDKGLIILKISQLNLALVVTCHWIGCLWHSCANISTRLGHDTNWLMQDEEDPALSIDHDDLNASGAYLRSVYWSIVETSTVGSGDIIPTNIVNTFPTAAIYFITRFSC